MFSRLEVGTDGMFQNEQQVLQTESGPLSLAYHSFGTVIFITHFNTHYPLSFDRFSLPIYYSHTIEKLLDAPYR